MTLDQFLSLSKEVRAKLTIVDLSDLCDPTRKLARLTKPQLKQVLDAIAECESAHTVNISRHNLGSNPKYCADIGAVLSKLPRLEVLLAAGNYGFSQNGTTVEDIRLFCKLFSGCQRLTTLDISGIAIPADVENFRELGLALKQCQNLTDLRYADCGFGMDPPKQAIGNLKYILEGCPNLINLNIDQNALGQDENAEQTIQLLGEVLEIHCPKLEKISIKGNYLDNELFKQLLPFLSKIKSLDVTGNSIRRGTIIQAIQEAPHLVNVEKRLGRSDTHVSVQKAANEKLLEVIGVLVQAFEQHSSPVPLELKEKPVLIMFGKHIDRQRLIQVTSDFENIYQRRSPSD